MPPQAEIFAQVARVSVPDVESGGVSAAGSSDGSFVDACRDAAAAVKNLPYLPLLLCRRRREIFTCRGASALDFTYIYIL